MRVTAAAAGRHRVASMHRLLLFALFLALLALALAGWTVSGLRRLVGRRPGRPALAPATIA
jgi:hypothetical protein